MSNRDNFWDNRDNCWDNRDINCWDNRDNCWVIEIIVEIIEIIVEW